jgi:transcriptional regulator with XRE-family HTH domain
VASKKRQENGMSSEKKDVDQISLKIAEHFRAAREAKNITREAVAEYAGVHKNTIRDLEAGSIPGMPRLLRIASYLDIPVASIMKLYSGYVVKEQPASWSDNLDNRDILAKVIEHFGYALESGNYIRKNCPEGVIRTISQLEGEALDRVFEAWLTRSIVLAHPDLSDEELAKMCAWVTQAVKKAYRDGFSSVSQASKSAVRRK